MDIAGAVGRGRPPFLLGRRSNQLALASGTRISERTATALPELAAKIAIINKVSTAAKRMYLVLE
jgi:hypothetical protein